MTIIVTDRCGIESAVHVRSAYVVISIHDPDMPRARVRRQSGLRDVLYLAFHDAEPTANGAPPAGVTLMTPEHARQIREFVERHRSEVGAVVVHCEAGVSRSPAVAATLARWLGLDERCFHRDYQPNGHVYRLLCECCGGNA